MNKQLTAVIPEYQQEARLIQESPQRLSETMGNFKDTFEEVLSELQVKAVYLFTLFKFLFALVFSRIRKLIFFCILIFKQRIVSDGKLSAAQVLSTTSEIGTQLFATLEAHFMDMDDRRSSTGNNALIPEQKKLFHERLNRIITSLQSSEGAINVKEERSPRCRCEHKVVVWPRMKRHLSLIILAFSVLCLGYFMSFFKMLML